jgi:hypothetical protein
MPRHRLMLLLVFMVGCGIYIPPAPPTPTPPDPTPPAPSLRNVHVTLTAPQDARLVINGEFELSLHEAGELAGIPDCPTPLQVRLTAAGYDTFEQTTTDVCGRAEFTVAMTRRPDPPTPPEPPQPEPPQPPQPPTDGVEAILRGIGPTIADADIHDWSITSTVTGAVHRLNGELCIEHTKAGVWQSIDWLGTSTQVEGNQWIAMLIDGVWHWGASEWLRPGQTCKHYGGSFWDDFADPAIKNQWRPAPGDRVLVGVSTPARRNHVRPTEERSNFVFVIW